MSVDPSWHQAVFGGPEIVEGIAAGPNALQALAQAAASALLQGGMSALMNMVTPNGEKVSSLPPEARRDLIHIAMKLNSLAPSADDGDGSSGPVDVVEAASNLGIVPRPLPPLRRWPYAVVFNQWWPMHPWNAANSSLRNILNTEDQPTYVPDATWDSPLIPSAVSADIAFSDFKWPLGITFRPYAMSVDLNSSTSVLTRYVL